jgi:hypothetical protein
VMLRNFGTDAGLQITCRQFVKERSQLAFRS